MVDIDPPNATAAHAPDFYHVKRSALDIDELLMRDAQGEMDICPFAWKYGRGQIAKLSK
jgi:hypothetical protein